MNIKYGIFALENSDHYGVNEIMEDDLTILLESQTEVGSLESEVEHLMAYGDSAGDALGRIDKMVTALESAETGFSVDTLSVIDRYMSDSFQSLGAPEEYWPAGLAATEDEDSDNLTISTEEKAEKGRSKIADSIKRLIEWAKRLISKTIDMLGAMRRRVKPALSRLERIRKQLDTDKFVAGAYKPKEISRDHAGRASIELGAMAASKTLTQSTKILNDMVNSIPAAIESSGKEKGKLAKGMGWIKNFVSSTKEFGFGGYSFGSTDGLVMKKMEGLPQIADEANLSAQIAKQALGQAETIYKKLEKQKEFIDTADKARKLLSDAKIEGADPKLITDIGKVVGLCASTIPAKAFAAADAAVAGCEQALKAQHKKDGTKKGKSDDKKDDKGDKK